MLEDKLGVGSHLEFRDLAILLNPVLEILLVVLYLLFLKSGGSRITEIRIVPVHNLIDVQEIAHIRDTGHLILAVRARNRIVARHSDMVIVIVSHHQVVQMLGVKSRFRQIVGHISHDPLSRCSA